jgi:outer membrane phospholipase A
MAPWVTGFNLGYTQKSLWDLKSDSSPFEDTSYMPEFFYLQDKIDLGVPWISAFGFQTGYQHESNGRDGGDRVLQDPQPLCHVTGFSDSSVDMDLRLWIKDPENGMANLKGAVFLAVFDVFGKTGIKIPYPQRDLHIKSGWVPLPADAAGVRDGVVEPEPKA